MQLRARIPIFRSEAKERCSAIVGAELLAIGRANGIAEAACWQLSAYHYTFPISQVSEMSTSNPTNNFVRVVSLQEFPDAHAHIATNASSQSFGICLSRVGKHPLCHISIVFSQYTKMTKECKSVKSQCPWLHWLQQRYIVVSLCHQVVLIIGLAVCSAPRVVYWEATGSGILHQCLSGRIQWPR